MSQQSNVTAPLLFLYGLPGRSVFRYCLGFGGFWGAECVTGGPGHAQPSRRAPCLQFRTMYDWGRLAYSQL